MFLVSLSVIMLYWLKLIEIVIYRVFGRKLSRSASTGCLPGKSCKKECNDVDVPYHWS